MRRNLKFINRRFCNVTLLVSLSIMLAFLLTSCSNTKYLKEGEILYTGSNVSVASGKSVKGRKSIVNNSEDLLKPKPNKKFLGMRLKLWFYNVAGNPSGKGFRSFVKYKLGQKPVLLSDVYPEKIRNEIDATLFNNGYFGSYSNFNLENKGKTVKVNYQLFLSEPYIIDSVKFAGGNHIILKTIGETLVESLLHKDDIYSLENIQKEKIRIDKFLKTKGFFYFNPDYLVYEADTTGGNRKVNLFLKIKDITPYEALLVYRINDVYINTAYTVGDDSVHFELDTIAGLPYHYYSVNDDFRKKAIVRSVFLQKNRIYSRKDHNATLGQLMGMGTFKFVNVRFQDIDSLNVGFLSANINLTPLPRRSAQLDLELKTKSNSYIGPGFKISYRNRNTFKGAELMVANLHTSLEAQIGKYAGGFNSFEVGPGLDIYFPRFITPFRLKNPSGYYLPKTKITSGYDYLKRSGYFNLSSISFSYGYKWKETLLKDHELNPIVLNYLSITHKSQEFEQLLQNNLLLQKSFEEQFIAGMNYMYSYNEQLLPNEKNQVYFQGKLELSGNSLSLIHRLFKSEKANPGEPNKFAGQVYAQFARIEVELRNYYNINDDSKLVARLLTGVGLAYGNSSTLPYISQFFSGGASSIRAFRVRSLGPGTFNNESVQSTFYDQGGDMKIEGNVEYRYKIVGMFRGAFFADAGNIWLLKENISIPGGTISNKFLNELAVGGGLGLRLDANFFVLRLDLAIPFKKPWLEENNRWVFDKIKFGSGGWRRDNLLLNIAIGYPF